LPEALDCITSNILQLKISGTVSGTNGPPGANALISMVLDKPNAREASLQLLETERWRRARNASVDEDVFHPKSDERNVFSRGFFGLFWNRI